MTMGFVTAGDFQNYTVLIKKGKIRITKGTGGRIVDSSTVVKYELLTEESSKSNTSALARGFIGGALFGGVGAIAGAATAKSKGNYQVAVEFVDGKKSLLELDTQLYKLFIKHCFDNGKPKLTPKELEENEQKLSKKEKKGCRRLAIFFICFLILSIISIVAICSTSQKKTSSDTFTETTVKD